MTNSNRNQKVTSSERRRRGRDNQEPGTEVPGKINEKIKSRRECVLGYDTLRQGRLRTAIVVLVSAARAR
jgi:hypothetical protein